MEKEKLIIKNFGPIKFIDLDLGRFNVLIGEQATGKSTVAKVLAMCRYFTYIVKNDSSEYLFDEGLSSWGISDAVHNDTYISYDCKHYSFVLERLIDKERIFDHEDSSISEYEYAFFSSTLTPKTSEFKGLVDEFYKFKPEENPTLSFGGSPGWIVPTSFYTNQVAKVMDNPFYLPTERGLQSIFSLGKNSIQNVSDSLFNQFAKFDRIAKQFSRDTDIEPLDIIYKNEGGVGYIKKKSEGRFFGLYNAASGYQSTIPVVLTAKYYNEVRKKSKTFIIEEPELNIFPTAQYKLMLFLVDRTVNYGNSMLVTTHSPYVLTSLNNMTQAYQTGNRDSVKTENVIEKRYWINPKDVSAYLLLPSGYCEDIFDQEEGLIKASKIDEISRILNGQFDDLLNIEFAGDESNT